MRPFLAPPPDVAPVAAPVPSFSIVIGAYEAADTVGEAVASALAQTVPAREIIVCDDGSTDAIAEALAPYHADVTLLRQPHRGPGSARNAAVRAASSEFVAILDADDVYLPERLEALGQLASARPDLDILTTDAYMEVDGRTIGRYYRGTARFVTDDQRRGALHQHFIFGLAALRRARLLEIGGFDETIECGVDTDCFLRLILGGARAGLVDEPLARYRLRSSSVSSNRARNLRQAVAMRERVRKHPSLTSDDQAFLERELRIKRGEAALASMIAALSGHEPEPRRRALATAFTTLPPGYGWRTRIAAVGAALAPTLGRLLLDRRGTALRAQHLRPETRGR